MTTKNNETIKIVAGGLIIFYALNKIGSAIADIGTGLGIGKDQADKAVDSVYQNPDITNPFSRNFYKLQNPGTQMLLYTIATGNNLAKKVWDSKGFFNDDEDALFDVFKSAKTQSQVSFIADCFSQLYNKDMFAYMDGFLDNDELKRIIDVVYSKPKFKP